MNCKPARLLPALAAALLLAACDSAPRPPPLPIALPVPADFDPRLAYQELAALDARYPRHAGTAGALRAAEHIRDRLISFGLDATLDTFTNATPIGPLPFRNVIARLPGSSRSIIILASHFDTKRDIPPPFTGANDSGSSSAVLLELARVLAPFKKLPVEIVFAFFDGEEAIRDYGPRDGLHGSRQFARQLTDSGHASQVLAMILLDMVGDPDYSITIPANTSPPLIRLALQAAKDEGVRSRFSLHRGAILDDHVPFLEQGIDAVNLIDFEFGSAPGRNDYWHTPHDQLANVSPESLGITGRVVLRMVTQLIRDKADRNTPQ